MFIKEARARIIRDSRGEKTIEVNLRTFNGKFSASSPNGKSKGKYEAKPYNSKGISESIRLLNMACKILTHKNVMIRSFLEFEKIENWIKRFEEKYGKLGANATYALEAVMLKALAKESNREIWEFILNFDRNHSKKNIKMPGIIGNCIGGGLHSKGKIKPEFQEFLLIPQEESVAKAVAKNIYGYDFAKRLLKKKEKKWVIGRNDENAWRTCLENEDVLDILIEVSKKYNVKIGLDCAASVFYDSARDAYMYEQDRLIRPREDQINYIKSLIKKYNIYYLEDVLHENDFSGFASLKKTRKSMITGDDLTTTHLERIMKAVSKDSLNAVIIKPNQNGYLFEVFKIIQFCRQHKIKIVISHRSGETMDNFISDLAVGFQADFVKTGILGRERLIKLRRLIDIERSLKK